MPERAWGFNSPLAHHDETVVIVIHDGGRFALGVSIAVTYVMPRWGGAVRGRPTAVHRLYSSWMSSIRRSSVSSSGALIT